MQSGEWQAILNLAEDSYQRQLHYCPDILDLSLIKQNLKHVNGRIWLNAFLQVDGTVVLTTCSNSENALALGRVLEAFPRQTFHLSLQERSLTAYLRIMASIHEHNASGRITISGRSLWWNRQLSRIYPGSITLTDQDIPFLYLPGAFWPLFVTEMAVTYRMSFFKTGSPNFIQRCHRHGLRIDFKDVPDPQTASTLFELGADGIVTAEPDTFAEFFPARKTRTPRPRQKRARLAAQ